MSCREQVIHMAAAWYKVMKASGFINDQNEIAITEAVDVEYNRLNSSTHPKENVNEVPSD